MQGRARQALLACAQILPGVSVSHSSQLLDFIRHRLFSPCAFIRSGAKPRPSIDALSARQKRGGAARTAGHARHWMPPRKQFISLFSMD
jgi:hypothetical protein